MSNVGKVTVTGATGAPSSLTTMDNSMLSKLFCCSTYGRSSSQHDVNDGLSITQATTAYNCTVIDDTIPNTEALVGNGRDVSGSDVDYQVITEDSQTIAMKRLEIQTEVSAEGE